VELSPQVRGQFCRKVATKEEGSWQWLGEPGSRAARDHRSAVAVAWWADRLGRRHVRVKGVRWDFSYESWAMRHNILCPFEEGLPPLWMIYPNFTFVSGKRVLVACPCGVVGEQGDIGWMGDCCAACHDRREEGQAMGDLGERHQFEPWPSTEDGVNTLTFSADGCKLAALSWSWSGRGAIFVRNLMRGETQRWALDDQEALPNDLVFLPDGRTLAFTHRKGVGLFDSQTGQTKSVPHTGRKLTRLVVSANGSVLVTQASSRELNAWDLRANKRLFTCPAGDHTTGPSCAALSPDGRLLGVGCCNGTIHMWSVGGKREDAVWNVPHQAGWEIMELAFSPDGRFLASMADMMEDNLTVWDARKGTVHATLTLDRQRYHPHSWLGLMAFSPDCRVLAASEQRGAVKFWDITGGAEPVTMASAPDPEITTLAFSPDGHWLAVAGQHAPVRLWPWKALLDAAR
jgi:hypothetical protein